MRTIFIVLLLGAAPANLCAGFFSGEPEIGQKYDFICKDRQNIRNAEIISKDTNGYYVKISFMEKLIFISKDNIVGEPQKTQIKKKKPHEAGQPETPVSQQPHIPPFISSIALSGGGGYVYNDLSKFRQVFPYNHVLTGQLDFFLRSKVLWFFDGFFLTGDALDFSNDGRHLIVYSAQIGLSRVLWATKSRWLEWHGEFSAGAAYRDMLGYEFREINNSFIGQLSSGLRIQFSYFFVALSGRISYMHDQEIFFAPFGAVARSGIRF